MIFAGVWADLRWWDGSNQASGVESGAFVQFMEEKGEKVSGSRKEYAFLKEGAQRRAIPARGTRSIACTWGKRQAADRVAKNKERKWS